MKPVLSFAVQELNAVQQQTDSILQPNHIHQPEDTLAFAVEANAGLAQKVQDSTIVLD